MRMPAPGWFFAICLTGDQPTNAQVPDDLTLEPVITSDWDAPLGLRRADDGMGRLLVTPSSSPRVRRDTP